MKKKHKKRINIKAIKVILNKNKNYWNRKQKLIHTKKRFQTITNQRKKERNKGRQVGRKNAI